MSHDRSSPPPGRLSRYTVSAGTLVSLVTGRSAYRLIQAATTVLLLPVWGTEVYGTFAAAMATFAWLMALVLTGPEKTVLKVLPRAPRTGQLITAGLLAVLWWLPLPLVAAFAVVLARYGDGVAAVYVGVAAMQLSIGCTLLLVGLHRAHGRPRPDVATFAAMSAVQVALLAAAVAGLVGPVGFVSGVIVAQLALNVALAVSLGRPSLRLRHRPVFLRRLVCTAALLGAPDLYLYLSTAVLFTILSASVWAAHVGPLYVVVIAWSAGVNLLIYVFRVFAPRTSLALAGRAGPGGRRRAAQVAGRVAVANAAWLLMVVAAVLLVPHGGAAGGLGSVLVWATLLASRAPVMAGMLWASYRLENTDARAPRVAGLAAVAGMVMVAAAGSVTVPAWGAVGVIIAFGAGDLAYTTVIALLGPGRRPPHDGATEPNAAPPAGARRAAAV